MWPFKKKVRQRRLEVRKNIPAAELSHWQRLRQAGGVGPALLAAALYVVLVLLDVWPVDPFPYRRGQYVPREIHSRLTFKVPSDLRKAEAIQRAEGSTPATFQVNGPLLDEITGTLKALPGRLKATTQPADLADTLKKQFALTGTDSLAAWRRLASPGYIQAYEKLIRRLRAQLGQTPIVKQEAYFAQQQRTATEIILADGQGKAGRNIGELIPLSHAERVQAEVRRLAGLFAPPIRGGVQTYLAGMLQSRPTYLYDQKTTQQDIYGAKRAIEANPPDEVYDVYAAGAVLARGSRRTEHEGRKVVGLGRDELNLLRAEHQAYRIAQQANRPWLLSGRFLGRAGILLLAVLVLCFYIVHYQPRIVKKPWRAFAIVAVMSLMLTLSKAMSHAGLNPYMAIWPVITVAIIITIAYDQRFALAMGMMFALLVAFQMRTDPVVLAVLLAGVVASVFQLHEIRTRSKLIEVGGVTAVIVAVVVWVGALATAVPWRFALTDSLWAAGFAMLVGLGVQGFLPLVERVFRIATSMTLLEWCDASRPLLRRLAMEAPGTYNHSLQLGTMCETAAEAIGARGLLARVGAYYHDIGKINKPDYFIENQAGSPSRHSKLSPAMSLLIIIGHVKDGLELAREYGLPRVLHEFITAHHGTTLVQYFYQAAAKQRKADSGKAPDDVEFRYPGPKPQSREAAILMLADAAESSVRSMSDPTPPRIENQVHTMVSHRLMDGQLDECDLTLSQVHQIETSLVKSLCGIYHARISYPTPPQEKPSAAEK
ncbi:MAG: HDIG domain-containing protein [Planctomycetota bacterium]|nr:HDIG domain-containing protein [Planctomycetota bacterium]